MRILFKAKCSVPSFPFHPLQWKRQEAGGQAGTSSFRLGSDGYDSQAPQRREVHGKARSTSGDTNLERLPFLCSSTETFSSSSFEHLLLKPFPAPHTYAYAQAHARNQACTARAYISPN